MRQREKREEEKEEAEGEEEEEKNERKEGNRSGISRKETPLVEGRGGERIGGKGKE